MKMDIFRLAWKNLWRNRRRTLITMAAISLSLMLMQAAHNLSFGSYRQMIASGVRAGSGHIAIYRGDYVHSRNEKLSFAAADLPTQIAAFDKVEKALPRVYLPGLAQSSRESRGILVLGLDVEAEKAVNPFLKGLSAQETIRSPSGRDAIIGNRLLKELKIAKGSKFVITVQKSDGELLSELFRVRGVIHTGIKDVDRGMVMIGREKASQIGGIPGNIHELAVILKNADDDRSVFPKIEQLLEGREELNAVSWEEAMLNLANAIKLDYASQIFIFVIILLIVTIGVVNSLLMSVMERVREFGIILAIGATHWRLRSLVLAEALVLGIMSMILGTILGSLATWYLVKYGIDLRDFIQQTLEFGGVVFDPILRADWDLPWMIKVAVYMVLLCLLASLYPAIKASRIAPAEAMRHV